jgi:hypothetical protein
MSALILNGPRTSARGCFRSVDSSSEGDGKFVALAAEAHYQMVPRGRFGQTKRATPQTREPRAHIAGLAVALLGLGWAQHGLRGSNMTRVRAPALGRDAGEVQRRPELWPWEQPRILPSPKDLRHCGAAVLSAGLPAPARLRLLAHRTPPLRACGAPPAALRQPLGATARHLHLRWWQALQPCLLHLGALRGLLLSSVSSSNRGDPINRSEPPSYSDIPRWCGKSGVCRNFRLSLT